MEIQIKNRWTLAVMFECEAESLRVAVESAVSKRIDLSEANLSGADLSEADLRRADLSGADLRRADLRDADLRGAKYGDYPITITPLHIIGLYWDVLILDTAIKIGCQMHSIDAWDTFADSEIAAMGGNALKFWREHRALIMSAARIHAAKAETAKQEAA